MAPADAQSPAASAAAAPAPTEPPRLPAAVARQALDWLLKIQTGEASEADWRRWRAAHPDHERAGQRIDAVNRRFQPLRTDASSRLAHATLAAPARARRRQGLKVAALLLASGATGWLVQARQADWRPWLADLRSGPGERRHLTLADGSRLVLDVASAVDLDDRRAVLLTGQVLFETTAADPGEPFRLATRDGQLEAQASRFMVLQQAAGSRVDVFEGQVRLLPRQAAAGDRLLAAGQRCLMTADGFGPVESTSVDAAAWQEGLLVASAMPLSAFVETLARYSASPIRCAPEVAGLGISGTYPLADVDQILRAVARVLPVRIERLARRWRADEIVIAARS